MANKRNAKVELTLDKRRFDRGIDDAGRRLRGFSRDGRKSLADLSGYGNGTSAWKKIGGDIGRLGRAGGVKLARAGLIGLGGAAAATAVGMASLAGDARDFERNLTRFEIKTHKSAGEMTAFRAELAATSRATGLSRTELLRGADGYVEVTGDVAGAAAAMKVFGDVANATGASMDDIANVAAVMKDGLKIDPKDFKTGFSMLAAMGDAGSIGLPQAAKEMADIVPKFRAFKGGGGLDGLAELSAAYQIAASGGTSAAEAATQFGAAIDSMKRNAKAYRKAGVAIFEKDPQTGAKKMRAYSDIIKDVAKSKLAADPSKMIAVVGSTEGASFLTKAIGDLERFEELKRSASNTSYIDDNAAKYLESPAGRMTKVWEAVKLKMMEAFTPERIEAFAGALEKVVMLAAKAADLLDKLLTGGEKESSLLSVEQLAEVSNLSARFGNKRTMPDAGAFKSDEAMFYGRDLGGEGNYDLGKLFRYTQAVGSNSNRSSSAQIAGQVAGAVPGGDVARQVMAGMLAAAARMQFTVQLDGAAIAKASANAPTHRTRPGGV